ncbi:MAG: FkbM family methyltransferase, partial [Puia sp.]|nr:FkbM family methyltransferase [Puia sp.]
RARDLLQATIKRNSISNVEVFGFAVSDADGSAAFRERNLDLSGQTPFLPETSSLTDSLDSPHDGVVSQIQTIKLDTFAAARDLKDRDIVMKIDIEGYEASALSGGLNLLRSNRVHLAIDIHARIHGDGTTETDCKDILAPLGYRFEMQGHVLLCEPPVAAT